MPILRHDEEVRDLLARATTVAIVGMSPDPHRPSHTVATYLRESTHWTLWFVNPNVDRVLGDPCYATLADLPRPPDIVDVFRRREHLPAVTDDAIGVGAGAVWFQLGLRDDAAAARAADAGLDVVQDRCLKVERSRLRP